MSNSNHSTTQPELAKVYDPLPVERHWWQAWEAADIFSAPQDTKGKESYCIVIPPPNVTGSLHMGHALNNTLQDILIRYQRMNGKAALWVFGMDHAGIATQNVVERQLKAEGQSRQDLGREEFIRRVWQWKEESGGTIRNQLKKLGCSLDYAHERFTMDAGLSRAVKEVFVRLYEDGLIYRAERLINWCPRCQTALSDLEVEHEEVHGHLWHIRYPLESNPQIALVVATTRPETLLGDTAVAVHPEDERYQKFIGKNVMVPFVDRAIPILADEMVDREFGSGAVKITPAHDFNDFEVGNRHGLERINVLTPTGHMNENAGLFHDQESLECRKNIVKALEDLDLLEKVEEYQTSVGHCYRCKSVVEPYLSLQWFVKTEALAKRALAAVQHGVTKIIPESWQNSYFRWMENIQDWCISRQIWWGHRIPVWYCGRCADEETVPGGIIVSREEISECPHCGHHEIQQETDVLDTWFSSALWPFSTLGWPEETPELKFYYPTATLVTGFDILFFWVARMMMMGLHFTGEAPFKEVYIHALVRDAEGQKMSKSKGNVIDPLEVMEQHGTDAFRFTLAAFAAQGRDIKLSEERVLGYRNFCNKIWNGARLVFSLALPNADLAALQKNDFSLNSVETKHPISQWILTELSECIAKTRQAIEGYKFNEAANLLYQFFWSVYCDWFLEFLKPSQKADSENISQELKQELATLALLVLDQSMRLLHPIMPFLTEEIWQKMAKRGALLPQADFPQALDKKQQAQLKESHHLVQTICGMVEKVRQIRMETGMSLSERLTRVSFYSDNAKLQKQIDELRPFFIELAGLADFQWNNESLAQEKGLARGITDLEGIVVRLDLKNLVDLNKERARQEKELKKIEKALLGNEKTLQNPKFLEKSPPELQEEMRQTVAKYQRRIAELKEGLKEL